MKTFGSFLLSASALVGFGYSCSPSSPSGDAYTFALNSPCYDTLYFSQIGDSISYIPLKGAETNLIQEYSDLIVSDDYVMVIDLLQGCVWIFDREGNYLNCLNRQGHGHGEYVKLSQVEYDETTHQILVLDCMESSVLHYDVQGNFLSKEVLKDVYATDFKLSGSHYVLSFLGSRDFVSGVFLYDRQSQTSQKAVGKVDDIPWNDNWELCSWGDTVGVMAPPLQNTLYHIRGGEVVDSVFINVPRSNRVYNYTDNSFEYDDWNRSAYFEGPTWLWVRFWKYEEPHQRIQNYFVNKLTHQVISGGMNIVNDIDRVAWSCAVSYTEGNVFTFITQGQDGLHPAVQFLHLKY